MAQTALIVTLWISAVGAGLMAGVYFTFSAFVMSSLARIPQPAGISAMQSINAVIVRSTFLPLFFGTTLTSLALAVVGVMDTAQPGAAFLLGGGCTYVVGMFVCTVVFNVPLNDELAAVDPASPEAAAVWSRYLRRWTLWNHVRTVASTVACGLFIAAIAAG